jgi:prevent-host-death family protein
MDVPVTGTDPALADLVRRAEAGEEVVLTRDGMPVARVSPIPAPRPVPSPEERRVILDRIMADIRAIPPSPGPSAARSADFLYDDEGLPI